MQIFYPMGNRKSKKCKAKRAKQPKALKSKHQAWDKKSDDKSGSAFERFFSLLCFQWFCNKRRSDATEDEDDITLSRMAWHHAHSSREVDPMMDRVRILELDFGTDRCLVPNFWWGGGGETKTPHGPLLSIARLLQP